MTSPHTQTFEDAITVTPVSSHEYTTNLHPDWTIGAVPHGGYTMSILYRLATTHFKHTHPTRHNSQPLPISMQITFLRRTAVGPAVLTVEDSKLGLRTSTIHVTLSQDDDSKPDGKKRTARVVGYITISDSVSDVGYSHPSMTWGLYPPMPGGPPEVIVRADDVKLSQKDGSETSKWKQTGPTHWSKFRKVEHQCITFGPTNEYKQPGVLDQWARLRTVSSDASAAAGNGKWTNETLPFLSDWFPAALEEVGAEALSALSSSSASKPKIPPFWYPTVTLNIDFKKSLPPQGVDWLYSRVVMKSVRNGRMDIEVIILDEKGEIVALCSHIGLVVSIERNTSGRKYGKDAEKANL
ncbi:conserved hypothetical protein [Talaromyces stipitatus ATCC 10500]|uniref:Thioesterase family protein n=1 Tax=Talaromyces stipitatus (strain ATCC 10500 / CBS 375.48 / QM 6759 / NRRL 1006) TaxID=441959 RepID=B8LZF9_TALSN|nr:uncharacterized protein TSTA_089490 [Talaromyces stipitatus ATCC 10500]EED21712.1 conserved hypothetical protein [Talaromyces stipitatus ATCC 10500]